MKDKGKKKKKKKNKKKNEINFYYTMLHDLYTTPNQLIHICHKSIHMYINTY